VEAPAREATPPGGGQPAREASAAVVRIPRDYQPVDRQADMVAFADHLARVAAAHSSRELERRAVPAMTADDYAAPVDTLPDGRPVFRTLAQSAYPGTTHIGAPVQPVKVSRKARARRTTPTAIPSADALDAVRAPAPMPVLAALPPVLADGRPTCERCGQVFRKHGTGYAWHVANRPDCAASVARPSIAS
jgi:hypothetical protein